MIRRVGLVVSAIVSAVSAVSSDPLIPANSPSVWWSGRAVVNDTGRYFDWPNVAAFAIRGTEAHVTIVESARQRYHVYAYGDSVGGQQWALLTTFATGPSADGAGVEYQLAAGLSPSTTTTLMLSKITEADYNAANETFSVTRVVGFRVSGGDAVLLPTPSALLPDPTRRLEFIGDSLTSGYGSARFAPCRGNVFVQDGDAAWARVLCTAFNASCHVQAWSGRGLVLNYVAEEPGSHMPQIIRRTFASVPVEDWDWRLWRPSAVLINLGTNDFCCGRADVPGFDTTLVQLLRNLTQLYKDSGTGQSPPLLVAVWLPNKDTLWDAVARAISQAVSEGISAQVIDMRGIPKTADQVGCDGHPSPLSQRQMALTALPFVQKATGWTYHDLSPVPPLPF